MSTAETRPKTHRTFKRISLQQRLHFHKRHASKISDSDVNHLFKEVCHLKQTQGNYVKKVMKNTPINLRKVEPRRNFMQGRNNSLVNLIPQSQYTIDYQMSNSASKNPKCLYSDAIRRSNLQ